MNDLSPLNGMLRKRRRRLKPSEGQIQKSILQYLRALGIQCWRINSVGIPDGKGGFRSNPEMAGISDIHAIIRVNKIGASVWFEVKSEKGRLSPKQKEFRAAVESAGGFFFLVRSIEDVQKAIKFLGDQDDSKKLRDL